MDKGACELIILKNLNPFPSLATFLCLTISKLIADNLAKKIVHFFFVHGKCVRIDLKICQLFSLDRLFACKQVSSAKKKKKKAAAKISVLIFNCKIITAFFALDRRIK